MNKWFNKFATSVASVTGRSYTFVAAILLIAVWAFCGPLMGFSDTWQLLINTTTTLVTFLMVFIIQNGQNRAANAQQIKLDFILEVLGVDDDDIRQLETLDDKRLDKILEDVQKGKRREVANATKPKRRKANARSSH